MTKNANPALDPANNGTLTGVLNSVFNKLLQRTDGMLPARVVAYDRLNNPNFVQVEALIMILNTDGETTKRPQINIPLVSIGGGGFFINFNLNPGDLGWIQANDRDISLFLQSYNFVAPGTNRVKTFSDAVFYPDIMKGYTISADDATGMVISNVDGTVKIVLQTGIIKITAPTVVINSNITTDINGNLFVDGNIEATGTITPGV